MTTNSENDSITQVLYRFFESFQQVDDEKFLSVTHPGVRTVNIGNAGQAFIFSSEQIRRNTIAGLRNARKQDPAFYANFEIVAIYSIQVYDSIASADVEYRMVMPHAVGLHRSFYHLVQVGDNWRIVNIIDRGQELH
ncbi:MAG: nuclear transport factor 2 family protein [Anaerolineales bacterium]|nr:nuclear transport factor 2 family protein [Anaerolineales bacterium]